MINFTKTEAPGGIIIVRLSGTLDQTNCDYFFDWLQDEIDLGNNRIVVDCKNVDHLSSAGVGMLVRARSRLKRNGGEIRLADLQSHVADLLHFLHLDKVFSIYPSVREALASFSTSVGDA